MKWLREACELSKTYVRGLEQMVEGEGVQGVFFSFWGGEEYAVV